MDLAPSSFETVDTVAVDRGDIVQVVVNGWLSWSLVLDRGPDRLVCMSQERGWGIVYLSPGQQVMRAVAW